MTGYGIAFNKSSKYREMVNRKILEYAQSGELERSQRFWFSGNNGRLFFKMLNY